MTTTAQRQNVADYEWLQYTVIHPKHGEQRFYVHAVGCPDGSLVLVAFQHTEPARQVAIVKAMCWELGRPVVELEENSLDSEVVLQLLTNLRANPKTDITVLQVEAPK